METSTSVYQHVWLADDDLDDCEIFTDVLSQILPSSSLTVINNGNELMELLNPARKPDILFLDINMPYKDGLDCLIEIRAQEFLAGSQLLFLVLQPRRRILTDLMATGPIFIILNLRLFSN